MRTPKSAAGCHYSEMADPKRSHLSIVRLQPTLDEGALRKLALHVSMGLVVTDRDLPDRDLIPKVFYSIGLCTPAQRHEYMSDAALVYQYRSEASVTATVDDARLPMFMRCEKLNAADVVIYDKYLRELGDLPGPDVSGTACIGRGFQKRLPPPSFPRNPGGSSAA